MRTYDEIFEDAREGAPFSNGTEGYGWMDAWCWRCVHDKPAREDRPEAGCPLLLAALLGKTPAEWIEGNPFDEQGRFSIPDQYHCVEFRDEDDGPGPEPRPVPDPPGMAALIPREPYTAALMFTANTVRAAEVPS